MSKSPKHVLNGSDLAEALALPVNEGRFHSDGEFYKQPSAYPCAFFDKRGYIIVESETTLEMYAGIVSFPRCGEMIQRGIKGKLTEESKIYKS